MPVLERKSDGLSNEARQIMKAMQEDGVELVEAPRSPASPSTSKYPCKIQQLIDMSKGVYDTPPLDGEMGMVAKFRVIRKGRAEVKDMGVSPRYYKSLREIEEYQAR